MNIATLQIMALALVNALAVFIIIVGPLDVI